MSVSVDTGPVVATSPARLYDPGKWPELVLLRRQYIKREITKDCRYLSRFVGEAKEMYQACGYASIDEMLAKGYEVDPQEMSLAVQWLERNDPSEAIPLRTVLELATHGGDRKSEQFKEQNQVGVTKLKGNTAAYFLARLKRDHPLLYEKVVARESSPRQAAIAAGILKEKTILEKLQALWAKTSADEKEKFLEWLAKENRNPQIHRNPQ